MGEQKKPPREYVEDKLQLLNKISSVHHDLKEDITPDFIYAKLNEKQQEFIIEMTHHADFSRNLFRTIKERHTKWEWNDKKNCWIERKLNQEEKNQLDNYSDTLFRTFMTRSFMIVTLNINKKDNPHVRLMAGASDEEEELTKEEQQTYTVAEKIAERMGLKKNGGEQEWTTRKDKNK